MRWEEGSDRTFVVETINTIYTGAFMVAAEDEEVFGVLDLVRKKEANGLEGLFPSVDIVTEEEVIGFWGESAVLEEA